MSGNLYELGELYERFLPPDLEEFNFYTQIATKVGGPVLEVGCGTGRLVTHLLNYGIDAYGMDISPKMLEVARRQRDARDRFILDDMASFEPKRQFNVVIAGHNAILHLVDSVKLSNFLVRARRSLLSETSLFVVDVFIPDREFFVYADSSFHDLEPIRDQSGRCFSLSECLVYDKTKQHVERNFRVTDQNGNVTTFAMTLRLLFPNELSTLLTGHGFQIIDRFGTYRNDRLSGSHDRQICLCTRVAP